MSSQKKKLTRKRLNNALAEVYREHPNFFLSPPTKMSFFQHVHAGNVDDVKEFLEDPEFSIQMRDSDGNTPLFYAMDGLGGLPMVKLLVDNGADINSMNMIGEVPFHVLCRGLTYSTPEQITIIRFMLEEPTLLLFPLFGRSLEQLFLEATEDIGSFQNWYRTALNSQLEEPISPENSERARKEKEIEDDLLDLYYKIAELSETHVQYVNLTSSDAKERAYYYLDTRMTGAQLKEYMQKQVFRNPFMNIDLLFRGKLLDPKVSLHQQGVVSDVTITYQVRLVSGFKAKLGGKRKTRRQRR